MPISIRTVARGAVAVFFALVAGGCATIINGTTQPIAITSTPNGARVTVDDKDTSYTTPANVELERGRDHMLTFHLDGYQDETFAIKHSMSAVVAGNILGGGLIGWGVDAADGAQDKLTPETVQITLNPAKKDQTEAVAAQDTGLAVQLSKVDQMYSQKIITKEEYDSVRKRIIDEQITLPRLVGAPTATQAVFAPSVSPPALTEGNTHF
jgi:PEGA domain